MAGVDIAKKEISFASIVSTLSSDAIPKIFL